MNQITDIYCKGRYDMKNGRKLECMRNFSHIGKWKDEELIEHEKWELVQDDTNSHWLGFDTSSKFELLKQKSEEVKNEK